jgi:Swi5-dependent recombination DNA repair protein 1
MQLRNEIQTLLQAQSLATSNKDDDLTILIDRWRTASRAAAEELFASTRDRVNRMGGVGAWKEREKEQEEWKRKADREDMEAEREKMKQVNEDGGRGEKSYDEYVDDGTEERKEEKETFKCAGDDVSVLIFLKVGDLRTNGEAVVHHGHDAQDTQYRFEAYRLQQGSTAMGRMSLQ